jgi:hypothetical protein
MTPSMSDGRGPSLASEPRVPDVPGPPRHDEAATGGGLGPGRSRTRVVVVGNPSGKRVALLNEALARAGRGPAEVISYADLLEGRARLEASVGEGTILRIESPDRDFEAEKLLIAAGAEVPDDGAGATRIGREVALALEFDRGRIRYPRQWYLGFRECLCRIEEQRRCCPPHIAMNVPAEIAVMFDKPRCHDLFEENGVACPRGLGTPAGYEDLKGRMRREGMRRVFVKLAHGSSASGIVALETDGRRVQAFTTVETAGSVTELRLYNTRAIRKLTEERAIAAVVDVLCRERAQAEQWVPKASLPGGAFDLRVVVIGGRACHVVARVSRSPMTNLHLLNERADPELVRERMEPGDWSAAMGACERAAGLFPGGLYAGVDVVIAAGFRRHAVLEINAFGDLLPGIVFEGMDTYTAELAALGVGATAGGGAA